MLQSGYHLAIHLLNSTIKGININRGATIKGKLKVIIQEFDLSNLKTRNNVFKVEIDDVYFVKQPKFPSPNLISSLNNQKYVLELFSKISQFNNHNTFMGFDSTQNFLFEKFIEGKQIKIGSNDLKIRTALSSLADEFTFLHNPELFWSFPFEDKFGYRKPMLLMIEKRDVYDFLSDRSLDDNQRKVLNSLKDEDWKLFELIKEINWSPTSLIHFDLKWEHFIFNDNYKKVSIVDWEMADKGDNYWDIASIFYEIFKIIATEDSSILNDLNMVASLFENFISSYKLELKNDKLNQYIKLVFLTNIFHSNITKAGFSSNKEEDLFNHLLLNSYFFYKNKHSIPFAYDFKNEINLNPQYENPKHENENFLDTEIQLRELIIELKNKKLKIPGEDSFPATFDEYKKVIYAWINGYYENSKIRESLKDRFETVAIAAIVGKEEFKTDYYWRIENISISNAIVIRKNSEKRLAFPGTYIYTKDILKHSNQYGIEKPHVKLIYPSFIVRPNDADNNSTDLWILADNQIKQDSANWVRFYFHLDSKFEGIYYFIETISFLLNERMIPFELKLRNKLSSYYRSDVVILFIHKNHFNAILDVIAYIYNELFRKNYIRLSSTKFTFSIKGFLGLSYAENPIVDTDSFGNHRAKLIADFVIKNDINHNDFENDLINILVKDGYNTHKLYRSAFPVQSEYKYNNIKLLTKLRRPSKLDLNYFDLIKYNNEFVYLLAARKIGFIVAREANWFGKSCNWFSFERRSKNNFHFKNLSSVERAGISLFLSGLFYYFPQDVIFYDCSKAALQNNNLSGAHKTFYTSVIELVKKDKFVLPIKNFDNNGTISNFFTKDFIEISKDSKFLANTLVERFIDKKLPFPNAYAENFEDPLGSEFNFTITHGLSALGYFLLTIGSKEKIIKPIINFT